ncbi:hypothetical protein AKJ16_DCAP13075, partial [Drosera capensis]
FKHTPYQSSSPFPVFPLPLLFHLTRNSRRRRSQISYPAVAKTLTLSAVAEQDAKVVRLQQMAGLVCSDDDDSRRERALCIWNLLVVGLVCLDFFE